MNILHNEHPEAEKAWRHAAVTAAGWTCLSLVLIWIIRRVWMALFMPWWFNPDEGVIYYEVIRQLRLDPSQTFFDIPGTPFMSLTSLLTALWWVAERLFSMTKAANPSDFAFANIQAVFTLMRALTLGMFAAAAALAFDIFRRSAGALAGIVAALLFATLPIFVQYSYFVRSESLGLVLCLAAIWLVLYSRWSGTPAIYGVSGFLAGVAMAARYHFALVGFPVLLLLFFLRDREKLPRPGQPLDPRLYTAAGTLAALLAAGGLVAVAFKSRLIGPIGLTNFMMLTSPAGPAQSPGAKASIAGLWLLLGTAAFLLLLAHAFPQGRRWIWPAVNPFTLLTTLGLVAGFVLAHPEFLWRGESQLRSIQFYSDWTDAGLSSLGPAASWWKVTSYYFTSAFPELWTRALFLAGLAIVVWRRRPVHLAFAGGALLCFCAHPLHMKLWPHHVIPWLPFLCFVAAVPVQATGAWLVRRWRDSRFAAVAAVLITSIAVVWACTARLKSEDSYLAISRARTNGIAEMTRWLSVNAPPDAYLLMTYFARNDDGVYQWIEHAGVRVPAFVREHRNARIWRLDRSAVDGRAGYICMSRADIHFFREDFERKRPGSTYDPFENPNFRRVGAFGSGFYELGVFQFDCRFKSCAP